MELLRGKPLADLIKRDTEKKTEELINRGIVPTLGILRIGESESDIAYENSAVKTAAALGIHVEKYIMDEKSKEDEVIDVLKVMNEDENIHGILMFRPLPPHIDEDRVRNHIEPSKDVDGISDASVGSLFTGNRIGFPPCTAEAAVAILDYYGIEVSGKKAVVIGRSLVVGKPAAMMLLDRHATVTVCHSRTAAGDLEDICAGADIIISAAGRINTVGLSHVSGKQIIVDVGINFGEDGKMRGDVDFEALRQCCRSDSRTRRRRQRDDGTSHVSCGGSCCCQPLDVRRCRHRVKNSCSHLTFSAEVYKISR